jgi:hypothetical protein
VRWRYEAPVLVEANALVDVEGDVDRLLTVDGSALTQEAGRSSGRDGLLDGGVEALPQNTE